MITRRELAAVGAAVVTASTTQAVDRKWETIEVELFRLGVPTDDERRHIMPVHVAAEAVSKLEPVGAYSGWESAEEIGHVVRYFIRDGWLRADVRVPSDYAVDYQTGKWYAAPALYLDFAANGRTVTKLKGIERISLHVPNEDTLWRTHRTGV